MLFSELLLWGWLHRYRAERRIASAVDVLGLTNPEPGLAQSEESTQQKAQILREMAAALDAQDPYTDGHSRRVALHAAMIARKQGLPSEEIATVRSAAAVHDIGKLRTPPEVLHKPGMLTGAEFDVVKQHVEDGAEIVSVMEDPEITATVRHHHERFDGHGYPDGLVGRQTPVAARIIAVADTFDALTSVRPYRSAIPHRKALAVIVDASGTQLDPVAVTAFVRCYSGRRWVVFWSLLAVSPRRAFSVLTRARPGRTSLAASATAASPATVAAFVAAAIGTVGGIGHTRHVLELAQRQSPQATAGSSGSSATPSGIDRRRSGDAPSSASDPSAPPARHPVHGITPVRRQAVLGTTARRRSPAPLRGPTPGAESGRRRDVGAGGGGARGGTGGRGGNRTSVGASGKGGSGSRTGVGGVSHGSPGIPTPGGSAGGAPVVSGNQGSTPSPPVSDSPAGGGSTAGTPGENGTSGPGGTNGGDGGNAGGGSAGSGGGGNPGNGSDGSGGGSGSGSGGGGGGGHVPASKADCKDGGFLSFGFRNQGQCVAWVEHNVLH